MAYRTAIKARTLINLNKNIIAANSLLDFPFDFKFDIIIGNPPYVRVQGLKANYENESELYERNFKSATGNYDIYVLFMELSMRILSQNGKVGFILPHKFLISEFGVGIREILSKNRAVERLVHFGSHAVFADASTYTCVVILSQDNDALNFVFTAPKNLDKLEFLSVGYENLSREKWSLTDEKSSKILAKIANQPLKVKDVFSKIFQGIATSGDDVYLLKITPNGLYSKSLDSIVEIENQLLKPILKGEDIKRYANLQNQYFVIFPYIINGDKAEPMSESYIQQNFPKGYAYLKANETFLRGREKGKMDKEGWFLYIYPKSLNLVDCQKLVVLDITMGIQIAFDNTGFCVKNGGYGIIIKDEFKEQIKFYLSILNSSLLWFYLTLSGSELRGGYFRFNTKFIEPFGLPKLENLAEQEPFIKIADELISLNKSLQRQIDDFTRELGLDKLHTKLAKFYELGFDEFIKEFAKAKGLKFKDKLDERTFKNEWRAIFENDTAEISRLKASIAKFENELDDMVFLLYGLSDDEIAIVKGQ